MSPVDIGPEPSQVPRTSSRMARRAALGGFFGSVVEYYDFFIYGTAAALVFNKIFFPSADPAAGTLAALATFGAAYVARPLGALICGHAGDRIGRKNVLLFTLLMMGFATMAIGLLPTYDAIGAAAPALLVCCRLLQGISAGGEQVGASLLTIEHTPEKKRGFYTSWLQNGAVSGSILATLIFIPISALPDAQLYSWGWRIPFLLSFVMVFITLMIRRGIDESPDFLANKNEKERQGGESEFPVATLLKTQRRAALIVFVSAFIVVMSTIVNVFGLSYATNEHGVPRATMLSIIAGSQVVALFFHPIFGLIADRVGKKVVFVTGSALCAVGIFAYFGAIATSNVALILVVTIVLKGVIFSAPNGLWPSFFPEMFTPDVRYTGVALSTQLSFLLTGFAPTICYALLGSDDNWRLAAAAVSGLFLLAAFAAFRSTPAKYSAPEPVPTPADSFAR